MSLRRTALQRRTELRRTPLKRNRERRTPAGVLVDLRDDRIVHSYIERRSDHNDPEARFWAKVHRGPVAVKAPELGRCLIHRGGQNGNGYVQFRYNGRGDYAHRYAWERAHGPIPVDLTVDHICEVRACVNVEHLTLATAVDNYLRTKLAQPECPNGHRYEKGTFRMRRGMRECLICARATRTRSGSKRLRVANGLPDRRLQHDQVVVRQAVAEIRAGDLTIAQGARRVGCNPNYLGRRVWNETRKDVLDRDQRQCARCPARATDAHHRIARGMGGTSTPRIAFGMDNLIAVCRTCHDWIHAHPKSAAESGWILSRTADPATVLVVLEGGDRYLLTADGGRIAVPAHDATQQPDPSKESTT